MLEHGFFEEIVAGPPTSLHKGFDGNAYSEPDPGETPREPRAAREDLEAQAVRPKETGVASARGLALRAREESTKFVQHNRVPEVSILEGSSPGFSKLRSQKSSNFLRPKIRQPRQARRTPFSCVEEDLPLVQAPGRRESRRHRR